MLINLYDKIIKAEEIIYTEEISSNKRIKKTIKNCKIREIGFRYVITKNDIEIVKSKNNIIHIDSIQLRKLDKLEKNKNAKIEKERRNRLKIAKKQRTEIINRIKDQLKGNKFLIAPYFSYKTLYFERDENHQIYKSTFLTDEKIFSFISHKEILEKAEKMNNFNLINFLDDLEFDSKYCKFSMMHCITKIKTKKA